MTEDNAAEFQPTPGWPKVVGILSLVLGILALTCGVLGIGMAVAGNAFFSTMMGGQLPEGTPPPPMSPPMDALMIASSALGFVVNIILVAAAIMLLKRRPAGRTLHLVYALFGVIAAFFGTFVAKHGQEAQKAAMEAWLADYGNTDFGQQIAQQQQAQAGMQSTMELVTLGVFAVVALAWPVFCIIWFGMVKRDTAELAGADGDHY